ncbi:hypothetical protein C5167_011020 [Papaver somniferum]|uniref:Uncharacterized protein n=1 Tax=Papaver somniferum TaxID=3469 RepID=A0A4Y7K1U6_PAPSO|nr:O-acyltransferase WSD1-like isoform X1 [Papaver somniferum]RZC67333.1 hypothetical protein C5167_011020 [Papaver somniferum]
MEEEEPVTPVGRFFVQEEINQVINCVIGLKNPINIESIKAEIKNSIMIQHPRFQSVLVRNKNGREYWERTQNVNLNNHIFLIQDADDICTNDDDDEIVNKYVADLTVSSPLGIDKPLWELHILKDQNVLVWRIHHALGDGVSLMSLILAMCRKVDDPDQLPAIPKPVIKNNNRSRRENIWELVMRIWLSFVYTMELFLRCLCCKRDGKTKISGGSGVEFWPRKLATAKFKLDDMKAVKNAVPNATINDVLFGVISAGLSRYLDYHQPSNSKVQEGLRITGLGMVNLRKQPGLQDMLELVKSKSVSSWWGNKFGFILLPVYHHRNVDNDPLQYVKRAKDMLDKKKLSLEAHIAYAIGNFVMSFLGPKVAMWLNNRVCNTSFTISNVVGPQEEIMFGGNPITSFRVTSTSLSHALTMHIVSYAGKAEMQILVAKDVIPDPQFLAKSFEDALLEMKDVSKDCI